MTAGQQGSIEGGLSATSASPCEDLFSSELHPKVHQEFPALSVDSAVLGDSQPGDGLFVGTDFEGVLLAPGQAARVAHFQKVLLARGNSQEFDSPPAKYFQTIYVFVVPEHVLRRFYVAVLRWNGEAFKQFGGLSEVFPGLSFEQSVLSGQGEDVLFEKGENEALDAIVLFGGQFLGVVEFPVDPLSPAQSSELFASFEKSSGAVVENFLGIAGCLDGFQSAKVFAFFFLQSEKHDAPFLVLASQFFSALGELPIH